MARIPLFPDAPMSHHQQAICDRIVAGPRGTIQGPLRAALHNPELADRWQALGALLRYETSLPAGLSELAILVTARHWHSQVEWSIHAPIARGAGLEDVVIDAVRIGAPLPPCDSAASAVHAFATTLLATGHVEHIHHAAIVSELGVTGVVELTALIGYYSMVAFTLNAHEIPLPKHLCADLPERA